jgi:hypothetical protein
MAGWRLGCESQKNVEVQVDREADLLNRGRSVRTIQGLRRRISSLFLMFVETPEFNPEASAIQVTPCDPKDYLERGARMAAASEVVASRNTM